MIAVIQRVKNASVEIDGKLYSRIDKGILVLLGVEKNDSEEATKFLANKIAELRIFEDEVGKMNLSVLDIKGEILVVSQFTLAGDYKKGKRPSFDNAAKPDTAIPLYEKFIKYLEEKNISVKTGKFAAMMDISLVNDGPVTFILNKHL
ncbi:MAG: D-aminoacyl-tRNA deacylase [bacterium]